MGDAVPLLVVGDRQTEIGAEVDDVADDVDERSGDGLRLAVRKGEEDDVEAGEVAGRDLLVDQARDTRRPATGTAPPATPALVSAVTAVTSISGWPASNRSSSAPVYPDPPTIAARYAMAHTIQENAYLCQGFPDHVRRRWRVPHTESTAPPIMSLTATIHSVTSRPVWLTSTTTLLGS